MHSSAAQASPDSVARNSGEPHRIYWQQWIVGSNSTASDGTTEAAPTEERLSRRELITSSAAVRLSRSAKASDLTALLRKTLQLPEPSDGATESPTSPGGLVLVGTLYSLPPSHVQYENETLSETSDRSAQNSFSGDPFHVVRTLRPSDSPLQARDEMELYLARYLERSQAMAAARASPRPSSPQRISTDTLPTSSTHSTGIAKRTSTATIAPKLQWYYVPASVVLPSNSAPQAMIPNCVELDGYSTTMEQEDDEVDSDDDSTSTTQASTSESVLDTLPTDESIFQTMCQQFPWLSTSESENTPTKHTFTDTVNRRVQRERRGSLEHSMQTSACADTITGYLLKQDARDPNVWRRMFCTLTDNALWFVSRIYTEAVSTEAPVNESSLEAGVDTITEQVPRDYMTLSSYSKRDRITLTRALLVEPTAGYAPLFRTPYAFEIVSSRGTPHVFRANSKQVQRMWISALSDRIVQSYESSLMQHAEMIVMDECLARSRRTMTSAVTPLWAEAVRVANSHQSDLGSKNVGATKASIGNSIGSVLRWGLDVALYRDQCRYIGSSMPAKSPVLVVTPPRRRFFASTRYRSGSADGASEIGAAESQDSLDPVTRHMIRTTWDHAAALLARATSLALTLQVRSSIKQYNDMDDSSSGEPVKLSHGVETLCRHIEFVITGRSIHKGSSQSSKTTLTPNAGVDPPATGELEPDLLAHQNRPPPGDLFDHLLSELQSLAALADRRVHHREITDRYPQNLVESTR